MTQENIKQTFSIKEAAAILGVCPHTVYRNVNKGNIPASKVGRLHKISKSTIQGLVGDIH